MIINVDKEGEEAIKQLCNIALLQGGIQNLQGVNAILAVVKIIDSEDQKP